MMLHKFYLRSYFFGLVSVLMCSCASYPSPENRLQLADQLAAQRNWQAFQISTEWFRIHAYGSKSPSPSPNLTVYIEGDGLAWLNLSTPSDDPTPVNPMGLRLAIAQPEGQAVYLARPCQYQGSSDLRCHKGYWTDERFAREIISASNQAINVLKDRYKTSSLTLVGYSGGGTIAALIAAHRKDVKLLVTVAGNLNTSAWTAFHNISPLQGSLNPANEISQLIPIPQVHFAGHDDKVISPKLILDYASLFPKLSQPDIYIIEGFDHHCCWDAQWPELWRMIFSRF